jgi:hypothetical protein
MMHAMAPGLTEEIFAKQVEQRHFDDRPAPPSEGNLFRPMKYESITGGWRATSGDRQFSKQAWFGAAAFATGIALYWLAVAVCEVIDPSKLFYKNSA